MKRRITGIFCAGFILLSVSSPVIAKLISRLDGEAVYDTDLNITWLADSNAATGSVYDDGSPSIGHDNSSPTDGRMTWLKATQWADSLTVGGFSDWRLPTSDPNCIKFNCTGSEMGHLFYDELSGTENSSILNSADPDLALFSINTKTHYWSTATDRSTLPNHIAGLFVFSNGEQLYVPKDHEWSAWAVRSGDVINLPEPVTFWLVGGGLLVLLRFKRRQS